MSTCSIKLIYTENRNLTHIFSEYYLYKLEDIAKYMCILTFNLQLILFSIYLQSKYILIILIIYAW